MQTKAEDTFCVHILILKHFKLILERDDPALHFHLCLSSSAAAPISEIPSSGSSLSTHANPGGFEVRNLNTHSHTSFSGVCVPHAYLRSLELRHDTWVLFVNLSPLCFSH